MQAIRPQQYIDENYPGSGITTSTIKNWIKRGLIRGTQTPTGHWLVIVENDEPQNDKVDNLVKFLES